MGGPWEQFAQQLQSTQPPPGPPGPWQKFAKPNSAGAPASPPPDQFASDRNIVNAWAEKHPYAGPVARFLVSGGQSAASAIADTPGQVYHAIVDPPEASELVLPPDQRIVYRLGLRQAVEAGQDYASGKVTPKGAASVLPEALGAGVGAVAGGATYGKVGEVAPEIASGVVPPTVRAVSRGVEGALNSKVNVFKSLANLNTPADEAAALKIKVPGRDYGLRAPIKEGAPLPENPGAEFLKENRGIEDPGAPLPATPAPEQLNPSLISPSRTLPGQVGPERIFGPRPTPAQPIPARSGLALPGEVAPAIARPGAAGSMVESITKEPPAAAAPIARPTSKVALGRQLDQAIPESLGVKPPEPLKPNVSLKNQIKTSIQQTAPLPEGFTPTPDSGALRGYKYNPAKQELEAITINNQRYVHGDVSPEQFAQFEAEKSKGTAWNALRKAPGVVRTAKNGQPNTPPAARRSIVIDPDTGEPELADVVAAKQNEAKVPPVARPNATAKPKPIAKAAGAETLSEDDTAEKMQIMLDQANAMRKAQGKKPIQ